MSPRGQIHVVAGRFSEAVATGVRALVADDDELVLVADGVGLAQLAPLAARERVDVAIVDLDGLPTPRELRRLRERLGDVRIVALAEAPTPAECRQALTAGASACLSKDTAARDVTHALHLAARGLRMLPLPGGGVSPPGAELSMEEAAVLTLLREGRSSAETADRLGMDAGTVRRLARRIRGKLGETGPHEPEPPGA